MARVTVHSQARRTRALINNS